MLHHMTDRQRLYLANIRIAQLEAELAEARKDRKALYDSMRDVCRIVGGMTNDGVSVDFLAHIPAEVEAVLAEARRDGDRLDKLEALKKPGQRWMIHDWTFHKDITAYVGVWHGESYPGKSHETLREAIDDVARKEGV